MLPIRYAPYILNSPVHYEMNPLTTMSLCNFPADFNGDGRPDNITFMIKRIKIHNLNALKDPTYRFPGNYGVEKFLELFSGEFIYFGECEWV